MEESVFYIGKGSPEDKHSQESFGTVASIHTSKVFQSFRQADCNRYASKISGIGNGEKLFVASETKALINVYVWGKESVDQRMPIPEPLSCLDVVHLPVSESESKGIPNYRVPWLLAGGSKSGKVYVWELLTGNLVFVKDVHYQAINVLKFSPCGNFLVSGGDDSRCIIYKTEDLVSGREDVKPWHIINDHTLTVTDLTISEGLINDVKVYTTSKDSTLRVYNILKKELLTTFVLPASIDAITKDPVGRYLYVGLNNGTIRSIPMFKINNSVLEAVGGIGKIITVANDPELRETFSFHSNKITQLQISMDGTKLISGDDQGFIYVSDVISKQIIKDFKINSGVSCLQVLTFPTDIFSDSLINDKKTRLIPPFKRVLNDKSQLEHDIYFEIPSNTQQESNFEHWINEKAQEELEFKTSESVGNDKVKISNAYNELKSKYDELLNDHKQLLNQ